MTEAKPKANGAMVASQWKPSSSSKEGSTLRGHFAVQLGSGMLISGMSLHEKGTQKWIACPSQTYKRKDGTTGYSRIVTFADPEIEDNFKRQAQTALDRLLADLRSGKDKPEAEEDLNF